MMPADASDALVSQLNEQIAHEFAAHQQYVACAVYYDCETLPQLARFFYRQALEERDHAMMMVQYLLDADAEAVVPGVDAPQVAFADIVAPVALALGPGEAVSEQINALAAHARAESDFTSEQFMQWFIKEQVEEVATMSDLLRVVERSKDDPMEIENWLAREHPGGEGATRPPPRRGRRRVGHSAHAAVAHLERARAADRLQEPAVVRDRDDRRRRRRRARAPGPRACRSRGGWSARRAGAGRRRTATIAAIAARERWPGLRRSSGRRDAASPSPKCASSVRASPSSIRAARGGGTTAAAGRSPRARAGAGAAAAPAAATSTSPALGASVPSSSESSVVLPAPLGPAIAIRSPP